MEDMSIDSHPPEDNELNEMRQNQLREKLTREMNHRFQNNIQWLALLLEFSQADVPVEAARILSGVAGRLRTLSGVYGLRAGSTDSIVDALSLVESIIEHAGQTHGVAIECQVQGKQGQWQVADGMTFAVALLIGEIISNAVKHRRGAAPPLVKVVDSFDGIRIEVSNEGELPAQFDLRARKALGAGLDLASSMTQMQGGLSLDLETNPGWVTAAVSMSPPAIEPVKAVTQDK